MSDRRFDPAKMAKLDNPERRKALPFNGFEKMRSRVYLRSGNGLIFIFYHQFSRFLDQHVMSGEE
jgi:hypothetical protein